MWARSRAVVLAQITRQGHIVSQVRSIKPCIDIWSRHHALSKLENAAFCSYARSDFQNTRRRPYISPVRREFLDIQEEMEDSDSDDISEYIPRLTAILSQRFDKRDKPTLLEVYNLLQSKTPHVLSFPMYGLIFRILDSTRDADSMLDVFEKGSKYFRDEQNRVIPELVYRFGVVGHALRGEFDQVTELIEEMETENISLANEVIVGVMHEYATREMKNEALDFFSRVDPHVGYWNEITVNRVIWSLGTLNRGDLAMDFYKSVDVRMNARTIRLILSICRDNNFVEDATIVLDDLAHSNLNLSTFLCNSILQTLEFLQRNNEIPNVLEQMKQRAIEFDQITIEIIDRNKEILQDFEIGIKKKNVKKNRKLFALLDKGDIESAEEQAKLLVRTAEKDDFKDPSSYLKNFPYVTAEDAKAVLLTWVHAGKNEKLLNFMTHCNKLKGDYVPALRLVVVAYKERLDRKVNQAQYIALRESQLAGDMYNDVLFAFKVFAVFNDMEAVEKLMENVLEKTRFTPAEQLKISTASKNDDEAERSSSSWTPHTRMQFITVLQSVAVFLVQRGRVDQLLDLLDRSEKKGFQIQSVFHDNLFRELANVKNRTQIADMKDVPSIPPPQRSFPALKDPATYEKLWEDMQRRNIPPSKHMVRAACLSFANGKEHHQRLILDLYAQTPKDDSDMYPYTVYAYEALLRAAQAQGTMEDADLIFNEFEKHRSRFLTPRKYKRRDEDFSKDVEPSVPVHVLEAFQSAYGWYITKLADAPNINKAISIMEELRSLNLNAGYIAVANTWRQAYSLSDHDNFHKLSKVISGSEYTLHVYDANLMAQLVVERNDMETAMLLFNLFEDGNICSDEGESGNTNSSSPSKLSFRTLSSNNKPIHWSSKKRQLAFEFYDTLKKFADSQGDTQLAAKISHRLDTLFQSNEEYESSNQESQV